MLNPVIVSVYEIEMRPAAEKMNNFEGKMGHFEGERNIFHGKRKREKKKSWKHSYSKIQNSNVLPRVQFTMNARALKVAVTQSNDTLINDRRGSVRCE